MHKSAKKMQKNDFFQSSFFKNVMAENRSGRTLDIVLQVSELNCRFLEEKMEIFQKS